MSYEFKPCSSCFWRNLPFVRVLRHFRPLFSLQYVSLALSPSVSFRGVKGAAVENNNSLLENRDCHLNMSIFWMAGYMVQGKEGDTFTRYEWN